MGVGGGFYRGSKAMLDGAIKLKNKVGPTVVHASWFQVLRDSSWVVLAVKQGLE